MAPPPNNSDNDGLVARTRQGDNAEPLTITEISTALKRTVEDRFGYVRVRGEISRVSRPGLRVYSSVKSIPHVANGLGINILSTPKGVMADHEAREQNVGGEILSRVF